MIRVRLEGGLGNQLFQYAAGRALAVRHGCNLELDLAWFLQEIKGVTDRSFELSHFKHVGNTVVSRGSNFIRRLPFSTGVWQEATSWIAYREYGASFNSEFWSLPDQTYLIGYWQSYRYFDDILPQLMSDLEPVRPLSSDNEAISEQIDSTASVALHVRRGDYVSLDTAVKHHGALSISYYQEALKRVREQIANPAIFVFSDEPEWCRSNLLLDGTNVTFVSHNQGPLAWQDLILMSRCQHHIIANSSFSWWGAFLADQRRPGAQRIVISPKRWFNTNSYQDVSDRLPYDWIKL